ncbi:MAG: tetratricopeptide repeat protein [Planctomycetia bacterium]|nr:MAG: tetratricopeptide repeat protein [Planctomycetia bacterium]
MRAWVVSFAVAVAVSGAAWGVAQDSAPSAGQNPPSSPGASAPAPVAQPPLSPPPSPDSPVTPPPAPPPSTAPVEESSRPVRPGIPGLTDVPASPTPSRPGMPAPLPPPVGAVAESESTESILSRAAGLIEEKKYNDAKGLLGAVLARDAESVPAKVFLAQIAEATNDFTAAREYYRQILGSQPNNFEANFGMGRAYLAARYWRQAPFYLEIASKVAPEDRVAEVYTLLATAYQGERRTDKALEAAEFAVRRDENSFEARAALVALLVDSKKFDRSVEEAQRLVGLAEETRQRTPGSREMVQRLNAAYETLIRALTEAHNDLYERNARGEPTDRLTAGREARAAELLQSTAVYLVAQADVRRLLALYQPIVLAEKAHEYSPRDVPTMLLLAQYYRETAQTEKAVEMCRKALEVEPQNVRAQQMLSGLSAGGAGEIP